MNFDQQMKQKASVIEDILSKYGPLETGYQKTIMAAMKYSLLAGGKRLRPMLMSETYHLFGGQEQGILEPFMAAIEMIHTYSLVHDDLPAMDNDEYRRGRKTTHVVYGEAMGILAGDGLLNFAFETALKAFDQIPYQEAQRQIILYQQIAKALQVLGKKAGVYGMIGGQVIDMEACETEISRERLDHMYQLKTGGLVEASMMIGAILAGATEDEILKVEQIAGDIGLAFQIRDDILDVTSSQEVLGKPVHSDEKNEKVTYVTLMGLDAANLEVLAISERAISAYHSLKRDNEFLLNLITMLVNRNY